MSTGEVPFGTKFRVAIFQRKYAIVACLVDKLSIIASFVIDGNAHARTFVAFNLDVGAVGSYEPHLCGVKFIAFINRVYQLVAVGAAYSRGNAFSWASNWEEVV